MGQSLSVSPHLNKQHYLYQMPRILAFDIGIKNLAWCLLEQTTEQTTILEWDNYNLLSDSSNLTVQTKQSCIQCKSKAAYTAEDTVYCSRHCPPTKQALRDISGNLLKKLPPVKTCRAILQAIAPNKTHPTKKDAIQEALKQYYALPIQVPKVSKAPDAGLTELHSSIQNLVKNHVTLWSSCTTILLENQPAFKNPTMKSVQMLLFATLRDLLTQPPPRLKLVHAGKKVQGAEKGDAGYKDRKAGSEARVSALFKTTTLTDTLAWSTKYASASKKSDLADALCMCIDGLEV